MRRIIRLGQEFVAEVECNLHGVRRAGQVILGRRLRPVRRLYWEPEKERAYDWFKEVPGGD